MSQSLGRLVLLMNYHIRDATLQDFDIISEINQEALPYVSELDISEFSRLIELCEYSKVIESHNEVVAYVFALGKGLEIDEVEYNWFCENISDNFLYIDQVAVKSLWKGMGCGRLLYKDLESYAVVNKTTALVCEVNYKPLNQCSMDFHKSLGFSKITQIEARGMIVSLFEKRNLSTNNLQ